MERIDTSVSSDDLRPPEVVADQLREVAAMQDRVELTEQEQTDFARIAAITKMHDLIIDDTPMSAAASVLVEIMSEFAADGEPFQPSGDSELRQFLEAKVAERCPGLTEEDKREVFNALQDFPPLQ